MVLGECGVNFEQKMGLNLDKYWDVAKGGLMNMSCLSQTAKPHMHYTNPNGLQNMLNQPKG